LNRGTDNSKRGRLAAFELASKRLLKRRVVAPMRHSRNAFVTAFVRLVFLTLRGKSFVTPGQGRRPNGFPHIRIKNFGQMTERLYRGGQPAAEDFKDLSALGVRTVLDLRERPEAYAKSRAESLGMRYVNIPMSDIEYPQAEHVRCFFDLVDDPATGTLYVHCAGGRHRTGVLGAAYRFAYDKWGFEQVYEEMKSYDFYTLWLHGEMKRFVEDFCRSYDPERAASGTTSGRSSSTLRRGV
jgi:protein tyrosine phosphatase (PTP) superfamily phosphohydrolase (DUF442 family)